MTAVSANPARRYALTTPPIPDEIRAISHPGYLNIFDLQDDDRYRMPDPNHPNLWGTETLCSDWSGRLLIILKDFAGVGWHENQTRHDVPFYSHTPKSVTNKNLVRLLNRGGIDLNFEGDGNTSCGAVYASACFLLKQHDNLSTTISRSALEASWPALEFTIANMPNLTDIVLGGSEAFQTFAANGGLDTPRAEALQEERPVVWRDGIRLHVTSHVGSRGVNSRVASSGARGKVAVAEDWDRILQNARLGKYA